MTQLVLEPLTQLTEISFNDVQEKQLQCVQYLLHCYGDEINGSWLRFIKIIGAIGQSHRFYFEIAFILLIAFA